MHASDTAISLTIDGAPDLGSGVLQSLYRITGRSSVELRHAIRAGEPVYTAALFGSDHIEVVPRLQRTLDHLDGLGLRCTIHEWREGVRAPISCEVMHEILEVSDAEGADADGR